MRKLCPNYDCPEGLDTVLEVPIPEEIFASTKTSNKSWQNMKSWMNMKPSSDKSSSPPSMAAVFGGRNTEIQLLLGVIGAPLIPLPIKLDHDHNHSISKNNIKDYPIVSLLLLHILLIKLFNGLDSEFFSGFFSLGSFHGEIYSEAILAAVGGEKALNSIDSMYAMGKVKMAASEFCASEGTVNKIVKVRNLRNGDGEGEQRRERVDWLGGRNGKGRRVRGGEDEGNLVKLMD